MNYVLWLKNARLELVRAAFDGGTLEIGTAGMSARIATILLDKPSGQVADASLRLLGFPKLAMAEAAGRAAAAQIKNAEGEVVASGLTVGLAEADVVLGKIDIAAENIVRIDRAEIPHA